MHRNHKRACLHGSSLFALNKHTEAEDIDLCHETSELIATYILPHLHQHKEGCNQTPPRQSDALFELGEQYKSALPGFIPAHLCEHHATHRHTAPSQPKKRMYLGPLTSVAHITCPV